MWENPTLEKHKFRGKKMWLSGFFSYLCSQIVNRYSVGVRINFGLYGCPMAYDREAVSSQ